MAGTGNPTLSEKRFRYETGTGTMTLSGTAVKTMFLLVILAVGAYISWTHWMPQFSFSEVMNDEGELERVVHFPAGFLMPYLGCLIGGFILAMITISKKKLAPLLAPFYAFLEGYLLAGFTAILEAEKPGVAPTAVLITGGIFFALLLIYSTGVIRPSANFRMGIMAAMMGILILYVANLVSSALFGYSFPMLWDGGWLSILVSSIIVIVASACLVLDFDFIENAVAMRAPKYMEWYGAFGLLVSLVWLYIEVARWVYLTKK